MTKPGTRAIHIGLIILFAFLSYLNTFNVPFHFDDNGYVSENPALIDPAYLIGLKDARELGVAENVKMTIRTRVTGYLSFHLNYRLGGLDVRGYHAVNLLLHAINAVLLYLLVLVTFKTPAMQGSRLAGRREYVALLAALVFVSHPVQTQAVTYISQRFTLLAAMFYLSSLLFYARHRTAGGGPNYALCVLSALLAMMSKENAFTLPLAASLYEAMFFRGDVKWRVIRLVPLFLAAAYIPAVLMEPGRPFVDAALGVTMTQEMVSRHEYLVTSPRVIVTYIRLLFLPFGQNLDYDYPLYGSFLNPGVILSVLFLFGVIAVGVYAVRRSVSGEPALRFVGLGVFWFFLTLLVENSVFPLADVINEHRLYLPSSMAFASLSTLAFIAFGRRSEGRPALAVAVFLVLPLALVVASLSRNSVWATPERLWGDVVMKSPKKARGHFNLGTYLGIAGRHDQAIEYFRTTTMLDSKHYKAYNNMGNSYRAKGAIDEAIMQYRAALILNPGFAETHNNLGNALRTKGMLDDAEKEIKLALGLRPNYPEAYNNLGIVFREKGSLDQAVECYNRALALRPLYAEAMNNLGTTYAMNGDLEMAVEAYLKAVSIRPDLADAHYNLALVYREMGRKAEAARHYLAAVGLNPSLAER